MKDTRNIRENDIAIVGMAGKFPMADNIDEFWRNLVQGKDCISRRKAAEIDDAVKYAYGAIREPFNFDNKFFKINSVEAKDISPQERLLLEVSYKTLEDAGCVPNEFDGKIGIVCGAPENDYRNRIMMATQAAEELSCIQFSDSSLVTRVSYKLNLTGPCIYLLTACATSLSAVHVASKILINKEADAVLAGGSNVYPNQDIYGVVEGLLSKDGVVRAFDKNGSGTVPGNGVAMILLKRLEDAIQEEDHIYAVIKGSAIGNDGNRKMGFTAPSLLGQIEVLENALKISEVDKSEIDYIETHGTATPLGDAVELSALKEVYSDTKLKKPIALGALKSNYGHLNMVAGIAGIIKASLVLKYGIVPSAIHIENVNGELEDCSILSISDRITNLDKTGRLLHAAVSSFGMGGVNAHVVLEEYREKEIEHKKQSWILPISASSETSLYLNKENQKEWLINQDESLGNVSYTLFNFRSHYRYRSYLIALADRCIKFESPSNYIKKATPKNKITFMFPGMGTSYINMGVDIFNNFSIFSKYFNQCRDIIRLLSRDKIDILLSSSKEDSALSIVSVSYSMAKALEELGVIPDKLIGHSLGEYSMALFNGVFSLEDGLKMVYIRNELIKKIADGKMIAIVGDLEKIKETLPSTAVISIRNTSDRFTITCLERDYDEIVSFLSREEIPYKELDISKPYHSYELGKIEENYLNELNKVSFHKGTYDMISTYYGREVTSEKISTPQYWIKQMCGTVDFYHGFEEISKNKECYDYELYIEIGANNNLGRLANLMLRDKENALAISALSSNRAKREEWVSCLELIGELWTRGIEFDYSLLYSEDLKRKVSLPTYSFDKYYYNKLEEYYPQKSCINIDDAKWENFYKMDKMLDEKKPTKLVFEYEGLQEVFDQLCAYEAISYLTNNKVSVEHSYGKSELVKALKIIPNYVPFFEFLLKVLVKQEIVFIHNDTVLFKKELYKICQQDIVHEVKKKFPQFGAYIDLLHQCAINYNKVFQGNIEGNTILYPEGSFEMLAEVYKNTPNTSMKDLYVNETVEIIKSIVDSSNSNIRILEIGSGTGRLTWPLMNLLKNKNVEYWFTDIGRSFVRAGEKYAKENNITNMKFTVFDIEKNECELPIQDGEFDIILGLDVIQATSDIVAALRNLKYLLKPLGWVMMVQSFWLHDIDQMIYGYAPGWWNYYKDPLRKGIDFVLDEHRWELAFEEAGLYKVKTISGGWNGIRRESGIIFGMRDGKMMSRNQYMFNSINREIESNKNNDFNEAIMNNNDNEHVKHSNDKKEDTTLIKLFSIIFDTIGKMNINPMDSLASIGIDSLAILIIRTKIKKQFACDLMVKDIYDCKNIKELSYKIKSLSSETKKEDEQRNNTNKKDLSELFRIIKSENK
jgi:acyl transferase domain-containing protein/ubiquinone/menaquinone biosynthesis C-methylase UbiE/acyl carrier protein